HPRQSGAPAGAGTVPDRRLSDAPVVTPVVERYLRDLSTIEPDPAKRAWLADARAAIRDSTAVRALTGDLTYNALLRNTISITGLTGSDKTNVIPPLARAGLDVRLLPG